MKNQSLTATVTEVDYGGGGDVVVHLTVTGTIYGGADYVYVSFAPGGGDTNYDDFEAGMGPLKLRGLQLSGLCAGQHVPSSPDLKLQRFSASRTLTHTYPIPGKYQIGVVVYTEPSSLCGTPRVDVTYEIHVP